MKTQKSYRMLAGCLASEDASELARATSEIVYEDSIVYAANASAHVRVYKVADGHIIACGRQTGEGHIAWLVELPIFATRTEAVVAAGNFLAPFLAAIRTKISSAK